MVSKDFANSRLGVQSGAQVKRILICRPNHRLGNLLLLTPLLQEITAVFPNSKIDLFVKGNLAPILFKNYKNIDNIIQLPKRPFKHLVGYISAWAQIRKQKYDIVINVDRSSTSGRLSAQFANSLHTVPGDVHEFLKMKFNDYEHHAKFPIYHLRNHLRISLDKKIALLDLKLNSFEIAGGKKLLEQLVPNENKTICLFTYATGNKCYPKYWWQDFYERLRIEYPHFNIIEVLPVQNVSQLGFEIPTFYSKDIREIGSMIANTFLFIGADSGIMHLASAVQVPTIGLFSVTDPTRYAPYNDNSIAIDTKFNNPEKCIQIISVIVDNITGLMAGIDGGKRAAAQ